MKEKSLVLMAVLVVVGLIAACGPPTPAPAPTPKVVKETVVVEVKETVVVEVKETVVVEVTPTPQPPVDRPLIWASATEPVTLDPAVNRYWYSRLAQRGPYEPLNEYEWNEDHTGFILVPCLATSWEVSDDGLTYTYHLREGVKFTDGTPFNSQAVQENYERVLAVNMVPAGWVRPIKKIETPDDYTVIFHLEKPHAAFLWENSFTHFISPTAWKEHEEDGDWGEKWLHDNAVGTGPYMVKEWKHGEHVHLVKNPDWWGGWEEPHVSEVFVKIVPDATTRKLLLMKGEVDVADNITVPADLLDLAQTPGVVVRENPSGAGVLNLWIRNHGPLEDKRVRKAIALAFDYEGFARDVMQGTVLPGQSPLIKGAEFGFDDSLPTFKQDLEEAKRLLAEAGYPDGLPEPLEVVLVTAYQPFQKDEAQILQAALKELGIDLEISDTVEAASFLARGFPKDGNKDAKPDLFAWTYNSPHGDPDNNLRQYHCDYWPPGGMNGSFYCNREVSDLIDEADVSIDPDKRKELYAKIQRLMIEDPPSIWVGYTRDYVCYRDWVHGYDRILAGHRAGRYYKIWLSQ